MTGFAITSVATASLFENQKANGLESLSVDQIFSLSPSHAAGASDYQGIYITSRQIESQSGSFEYSNDAGQTWSDIGTKTIHSALYLDNNALLRYKHSEASVDFRDALSYFPISANIELEKVSHFVKQDSSNPYSFALGTSEIFDPKFTDIDADGDLDVFVSYGSGNIRFYENTSVGDNISFALPIDNPFNLYGYLELTGDLNVSDQYKPHKQVSEIAIEFADLDLDGDQDLFLSGATLGSRNDNSGSGNLFYYENIGNKNKPKFTDQNLKIQPFGLEKINGQNPQFVDYDSDGDTDIFHSNFSSGELTYIENITNAQIDNQPVEPLFATPVVSSKNLCFTSIAEFHDIDSDGDLDLWYGAKDEHVFTPGKATQQGEAPDLYPGKVQSIYGFDKSVEHVAFVDIDNDGDQDGFANGLEFWENKLSNETGHISNIAESYAVFNEPTTVQISKENYESYWSPFAYSLQNPSSENFNQEHNFIDLTFELYNGSTVNNLIWLQEELPASHFIVVDNEDKQLYDLTKAAPSLNQGIQLIDVDNNGLIDAFHVYLEDQSIGDIDDRDGYVKLYGLLIPETDPTLFIPKETISIDNDLYNSSSYTIKNVNLPDGLTSIGNNAFRNNKIEKISMPDSVTHIGNEAFAFNNINSIDLSKNLEQINVGAFYSNSLESITLPDKISSIGDWSFANNSLTDLNLPSGIKNIGGNAFKTNNLTSIDLPDGIESIGVAAFEHNSLNSVTIPESITSINDWSFANNSLTNLNLPTSTTNIGSHAFAFNNLNSIDLPSNLAGISDHAFRTNSLKSIEIPSNVTTIDTGAFYENSLESITLPDSISSVTAWSFAKNALTDLNLPSGIKNIGASAFRENNLTSIHLPDGIKLIGENAFSNNQLSSITIPESITSINDWSFASNSLTNLNLPTSTTNIGSHAFAFNNLNSIDLPSNLAVISDHAFRTNSLKSVEIPSNVTTIDTGAFYENSLESITLPGSISSVAAWSFAKNALTDLNLPSGIKNIGASAFRENNLTSIDLPDGIELIGESAFSNNQLSSITIPESITSINDLSFFSNSLTDLNLPSGIKNIGASAFRENNLTSIDLPDGIELIGESAFSNNQLNSIAIPESTTSIGDWSFANNSLTSLNLQSGIKNIGAYAFNNNNLTSIDLPDGVESIGIAAFELNSLNSAIIPESIRSVSDWSFANNSLSDLNLPANTTNIGSHAFAYNNLSSVNLPSSLEVISDYAFRTNSLNSIEIPNNVTTIDTGAFYENSLESITLPDKISSIGDWSFAKNALTDLNLPTSTTNIDSHAFAFNNLNSVNLPSKLAVISDYAFRTNSLNSIEIPSNVTTIDTGAFYENSLESITLPDKISSIGDWSFANNSLADLNLPSGIKNIGGNAFRTNNLTSIDLPDGIESIGVAAFEHNSLNSVTIPQSITSINDSSFASNSLTNLNLSSSITLIGTNAFNDNKLTSIDLPDSIVRINGGAFANNSLTHVELPYWLNIVHEYTFANNKISSISIPEKLKQIKAEAFKNNSLTDLVIPSTLDVIFDEAFAGNPIETLTIPVDIYVGASVFKDADFQRITIDGGRKGSIKFDEQTKTLNYLNYTNPVLTGTKDKDLFVVNLYAVTAGSDLDGKINGFQLGVDEIVVEAKNELLHFGADVNRDDLLNHPLLDADTEIKELRSNPLLEDVHFNFTPDLRAARGKLHAISGVTSLAGAGLRLAKTDSNIVNATIKVNGAVLDDSKLTGLNLTVSKNVAGTEISCTPAAGEDWLDVNQLQKALGMISFNGSTDGNVEITAEDEDGLIATTTRRDFSLIAPKAASSMRKQVVTLDSVNGADIAFTEASADALQVLGTKGGDTVRLSNAIKGRNTSYGFEGADKIFVPKGGKAVGGADDDVLVGSIDGYAILDGGGDNDILIGGTWDSLYAGSGNDTLIAIGSYNRMRGDAGSDIFVLADEHYSATKGPNTVLDFELGVDKLVLAGDIANSSDPTFEDSRGGVNMKLNGKHIAFIQGVSTSDNLMADVLKEVTSYVSPLMNTIEDVAKLQAYEG